MKRTYLASLIFSGFLILISCKEDEQVINTIDGGDEIAELPLKVRTDTLISLRNTQYSYDTIVGCGYDITEDLLGDKLFKAKVIDFAKYDAVPEVNYTKISSYTSSASFAASDSKNSLIDQIMSIEGIEPEDGFNALKELLGNNRPFMKTFQGEYDWDNKSISWRVKKITMQRFVLYWRPNELKEYLTPDFEKDLKTLTAYEVVKKYGTHVPLDLTMGGEIKVLLGANIESIVDYGDDIMLAASYYKAALFQLPMDFASFYEKNNDKFNRGAQNEYFRIKSTGGTRNFDSGFAVDNYKVLPKDNFVWGSDLDVVSINSCARIRWERCYPLYDFVYDNNKKVEVKAAIIQYIADSNK